MSFNNRTFAPLLFLLTTALTIGVPCAAMSEELSSGEYFETQSWSQEQDFQRSYYVNVPENSSNQKLPVFIFLHGNGGKCQGRNEGLPEATPDNGGELCHGVSRRLSEELEHRV